MFCEGVFCAVCVVCIAEFFSMLFVWCVLRGCFFVLFVWRDLRVCFLCCLFGVFYECGFCAVCAFFFATSCGDNFQALALTGGAARCLFDSVWRARVVTRMGLWGAAALASWTVLFAAKLR